MVYNSNSKRLKGELQTILCYKTAMVAGDRDVSAVMSFVYKDAVRNLE